MSKIEWTEETWNPVTGCTKHSPGCDNCYAEKMHKRLTAMGVEKYAEPFETVVCHASALSVPMKRKTPTMYFVNSMSDLFHKGVPFDFIVNVWRTMGKANHHTYQILTKRVDRMLATCNNFFASGAYALTNVWLGTSVESGSYTKRIDILRKVPAAVRFISFEPLIGRVGKINLDGIHWVIAGGESGPNARPMHPDWVREIRDQCNEVGVPFFFKQWGAFMPSTTENDLQYLPMRRVGKKRAGCILDGREWKEYPEK